MSVVDRRRSLGLWPPWTKQEEPDADRRLCAYENLSREAQDGLFQIARGLVQCNANLAHTIARLSVSHLDNRSHSVEASFLTYEDVTRIVLSMEAFSAPQPGWKRVLHVFNDNDVPNIWRKCADDAFAILLNKAKHISDTECVRRTALFFLEAGTHASKILECIEDDLYQNGFSDIHESISARLAIIDRFRAAYDKLSMDKLEPFYDAPVEARKYRKTVAYAYPEAHARHTPTMIGLYIIGTFASFLPLIQAWRLSNGEVGSARDVDFWLLVQTSIMQLLGIFLAMYPIYQQAASATTISSSGAWIWARLFTVLGICCIGIAIGLYLAVPPMWSAFVSSCGAAAQAGLALQLSLIAGGRVEGGKKNR